MEDVHARRAANTPEDWNEFGGLRFGDFMQDMKRVARLQRQAIEAQIEARQKRRRAGFKRREVWVRDATFMKELQRLIAQEKLKEFEDLINRAEDCQVARDELGPLEEEGIEAEQQLEGDFWRLRTAQESMFDEFRDELHAAENYSFASSSEKSSQYESSSQFGDHLIARKESQVLSGVEPEDVPAWEERTSDWDADSGIGDLDRPSNILADSLLSRGSQQGQRVHKAIFERNPTLCTEFSTKRDLINRWILNTVLLSRLEATILKNQLDAEDGSSPANWAQLAIEYWNADIAASTLTTTADERGSWESQPTESSDIPDGRKTTALPNSNEHIISRDRYEAEASGINEDSLGSSQIYDEAVE